jgi:hypothetical protein
MSERRYKATIQELLGGCRDWGEHLCRGSQTSVRRDLKVKKRSTGRLRDARHAGYLSLRRFGIQTGEARRLPIKEKGMSGAYLIQRQLAVSN